MGKQLDGYLPLALLDSLYKIRGVAALNDDNVPPGRLTIARLFDNIHILLRMRLWIRHTVLEVGRPSTPTLCRWSACLWRENLRNT